MNATLWASCLPYRPYPSLSILPVHGQQPSPDESTNAKNWLTSNGERPHSGESSTLLVRDTTSLSTRRSLVPAHGWMSRDVIEHRVEVTIGENTPHNLSPVELLPESLQFHKGPPVTVLSPLSQRCHYCNLKSYSIQMMMTIDTIRIKSIITMHPGCPLFDIFPLAVTDTDWT